MDLKVVTVLILWILVINGQIINGGESNIKKSIKFNFLINLNYL